MNILGKWRVAYAADFGEDGLIWLTPEKYRKAHSEEPEEAEQMLGTVLEFLEGGKVLFCMKIPAEVPQEQIDQAVKEGGMLVKDGYFYQEQAWKEEDGKYFYDSEIHGEVLGEEVSSWAELTIDDDGLMDFMGMLRLEKF